MSTTVRGQERAAFKDQGRNEQNLPLAGLHAETQANTNTQVTKGRAAQGRPFTARWSGHETAEPEQAGNLEGEHLLKSSQKTISAHRGVKVLCSSGKYPLKGEGRTFGPR